MDVHFFLWFSRYCIFSYAWYSASFLSFQRLFLVLFMIFKQFSVSTYPCFLYILFFSYGISWFSHFLSSLHSSPLFLIPHFSHLTLTLCIPHSNLTLSLPSLDSLALYPSLNPYIFFIHSFNSHSSSSFILQATLTPYTLLTFPSLFFTLHLSLVPPPPHSSHHLPYLPVTSVSSPFSSLLYTSFYSSFRTQGTIKGSYQTTTS